jgi:hypothetical protein
MTGEEWQRLDDPYEMLVCLHGNASTRKLYLFIGACVRRVWHRLYDERTREAVEWAECLADGVGHPQSRAFVCRQASDTATELDRRRDELPNWSAEIAILGVVEEEEYPVALAARASSACLPYTDLAAAERRAQAALLRCVFGDPFRPAPVGASWLTRTVTGLAAAAYELRSVPLGEFDPARLAVLADALEEAGCTDQAILDHLREPGPHVRGCWAVDAILAKE